MADLFRTLRMMWHRRRGTREAILDGIKLCTGPELAPGLVRNLIFNRTYKDAERALLAKTVRPGDTVLEIGGGIGLIGLISAKLAGATGRVVSYEAKPALGPVLQANYALNDAVPELRMRAITTDGAPVTLHVGDNDMSSDLPDRVEANRKVIVDSDALGDVLAELAPNVLVMDVEGAEIALLEDADLAGVRAVLIALHPDVVGEAASDGVVARLRDQGFRLKAKARSNVVMERRV